MSSIRTSLAGALAMIAVATTLTSMVLPLPAFPNASTSGVVMRSRYAGARFSSSIPTGSGNIEVAVARDRAAAKIPERSANGTLSGSRRILGARSPGLADAQASETLSSSPAISTARSYASSPSLLRASSSGARIWISWPVPTIPRPGYSGGITCAARRPNMESAGSIIRNSIRVDNESRTTGRTSIHRDAATTT